MPSLRQRLRELLRLIGDDSSWRLELELLDDKAHQRARQLLVDNLTVAQREQYESRRYFE